MPWKDTGPMEQRQAFITDWLRGDWTMTELAHRYGIARKTGYKWLERFDAHGRTGLHEHSRAPHTSPHEIAPAQRACIVALRRQHPHRGPKKLAVMLRTRHPDQTWPAPSTIGDLLRREGLTSPQRRQRYVVPLTQPLAEATSPNAVWTADFKGWFRTSDGTRCDPLTLIDACSRFVFCCRIVAPTGAGARPWFERAFRMYGLPQAMRTDNGPPFASTGPGRLSWLAVWWLKLGIHLDRIAPGHPEQNGRHERFHLTLKREATTPPAATPEAQQRRFDRLRAEFNLERPHEALGQEPPVKHYQASPRPYPVRLGDPYYDATHEVRRVHSSGIVKWRGHEIFVSEAVAGELVGLAETYSGDWTVKFMHVELGTIARATYRFTPAWHGSRRAKTTNKSNEAEKVLPMSSV